MGLNFKISILQTCLVVFLSAFLNLCHAYVIDFYSPNTAKLQDSLHIFAIDTSAGSPDFGKVTAIYDIPQNRELPISKLFGLRAGRLNSFVKKVTYCSDNMLSVEVSGFGQLGITGHYTYRLTAGVLSLDMKIWLDHRTDFFDGLNLDFGINFNRLSATNKPEKGTEYFLDTLASYYCHFTNLTFYDSTNSISIYMRNPFHSLFQLNAGGKYLHTLAILPLLYSTGQKGTPNSYSTLESGDTIFRNIELCVDRALDKPVFWSELPDGLQNALTMYLDELPNRDNWACITTGSDTNTPYYNNFIKLLNTHPKMKIGFVLLTDRLVTRPLSKFQNWITESPYIIPDTIDKYDSATSVLLLSDSSSSTRRIYQTVPCQPATQYTLSYFLKTQDILGNGGAYGEVYAGQNWITWGTLLRGTVPWQKFSFNFTTGNFDTSLSVYLRIQDSKGMAFFDKIKLSPSADTNVNLLKNPSFESVVPGLIYDSKRRHWTDAHGPEHISTNAPQSYIDFLKRLETHSSLYGWENRATIGCHGYHHSPSLFQPDPDEEFEYYDPIGDSLRVAGILQDFQAVGLTKASFKFWRCPGFQYTKSIVDLLVDNGCVFMDMSGNLDGFNTIMIQRKKNRLWLGRNMWWSDYDLNENTNRLDLSLAEGHLGVIGGHPEAMFSLTSLVPYEHLNGILTNIETTYPEIGYLFPDQYADNASAVYDMKIDNIRHTGSDLQFYCRGKILSGMTLAYWGTCDRASLDENPAIVKRFNKISYITLPSGTDSTHTIVLENALDSQVKTIYKFNNFQKYALQKGGNLADVRVDVYNIKGQLIFHTSSSKIKKGNSVSELQNISSGIYLMRRSNLIEKVIRP